jgi:hypothetical protein
MSWFARNVANRITVLDQGLVVGEGRRRRSSRPPTKSGRGASWETSCEPVFFQVAPYTFRWNA